jgi:Conserved domain frequently associated with peptide methionine sulfoxide reductase
MSEQKKNDDDLWRGKLTPEEYRICRQKGTEPAFSGEYWDTTTEGLYQCKCCGEPLFNSAAKFDSGCGWPSFFSAARALWYSGSHGSFTWNGAHRSYL